MSKKRKYIDKKKFHQLIIQWIEVGKPDDIDNEIIENLFKLINRISSRRNFRYYVFLDDMKGEAMIHCVKALKRTYSKDKDNPYGYFTTCIHNAFIQYIKKEKKLADFKFHIIQDVIDTEMKLDRSNIVSSNRNDNGDVVDEYGNILTSVKELREKGIY